MGSVILEKIQVLLVDDETSLLKQAEIFLKKEDERLEITTSISADKALEVLSQKDIDIIVSDYQMPDMNGLEFLEEIRVNREKDIPFIIFTGRGREEVAIKALNLGADRYLQKGGDPRSQYGVLAKAVVQEVDHHRTEKRLELTKYSVDKASQGIFWITPKGKFIYTNDATTKRLGYSKEELLDMHVWDIDPKYPKKDREDYWEELKEEGLKKIETVHETKDGELIPVEIYSSYIEHDDEELEFAFAREISKRRRAEEHAEEMRSLREAVREINQIIVRESNLDVLYEQSCKMLFNTRDYIDVLIAVRKRDGTISPVAHHGEHDRLDWDLSPQEEDNLPRCVKQVFRSGETVKVESVDEYCEGCRYCDYSQDHSSIFVPMTKDEKVNGILSVCLPWNVEMYDEEVKLLEEVSADLGYARDKIQTEENYRTMVDDIIEHSDVGIFILDADFKVVWINKAIEEFFGIHREEVIGKDKTRLIRNQIKNIFEEPDLFEEKVISTYENNTYIEDFDCHVLPYEEREERWLNHWSKPIEKGLYKGGRMEHYTDITGLKRMQRELNDTKQNLESIIEAAPIAIFDLDEKGRVKDIWNRAAERMFGWSREEVIGKELPIVPEGKENEFKGLVDSVLKGDAFKRVELKRRKKDGSPIYVSVSTAPLYDEDDEIEGVMAAVVDITEEKKIKEELEENEKKFRTLFQTANDGIMLLDEDTIVECNEKLLDMFEVQREDIIGKTPYDFSPKEQPDGRDSKDSALMWIEEAYKGEEKVFEWVHEKKDGGLFYTEVSLNSIELKGKTYVQAILRDISERKEAERKLERRKLKYETLFQDNPEAVVEVDSDFNIVEVNKRFSELFGYSEEEVKGKYLNDIIVPEDRVEEAKKLDETSVSEGYVDHETVRLAKDGRNIPVSITGRPVKYEGENHHLAVYKDISDRKIIENRLRKREGQLKDLHAVAYKIDEANTEEEVCRIAVNAAENILDLSECSIDLVDDDGYLVVKAISSDVDPEGIEESSVEEGGIAGKSYLEGKSYIIDDVLEEEDAEPVKDDYRSAISVPIKGKGVFQAVSSEPDHFDKKDVEMSELLMSHVSQALERLESIEREDFLRSLLRHDLKNKIQVINGYLDLVKGCEIDEEVDEYVRRSNTASREIIDMIDKVKMLRDIEKKEIQEIDIVPLVREVVDAEEKMAEDMEFEIRSDCEKCEVKGGPLLRELFTNVIGNSIKHSGGEKVKVSIKEGDEDIICSVEDDGRGIPDDIKDEIFQKGYKKGEDAGSGLGLFLVKEIAKGYDGSIEVGDSDLGGAKFMIRLEKVT